MEENKLYSLIGKYLAKEVSNEERDEILKWVNSSKANKILFDEMGEIWDTKIPVESSFGKNAIYSKISLHINPERPKHIRRFMVDKKKKSFSVLKYAASIAIVLAVAFGAYKLGQDASIKEITGSQISYITRSIPAGQKSTIHLPDGSKVILNSESTLRFPEKFGESIRTIELTGEAFFVVERNEKKPFTVITPDTETTVLGTTFNISAYPGEGQTDISLLEGSVLVNTRNEKSILDKKVHLVPGQKVAYTKKDNQLEVSKFDYKNKFGWKDGIIVFNNASSSEVFFMLERWYGVEFDIDQKDNKDWHYTGEFDNEYLSNVLESISYLEDFSYEINGKSVVVEFNK